MARPEVAGSGTGRHGCGRDDNDGRRGEPPCDGPPPWRWSSFSIAASSTCLAAPWTHLAAAWSICCRRRLLALTRKEMPDWSRHGRGGGVPPASVCGSTSVAPSSDRKVSIMCDECMVASMEWPKITSYRLLTEKGTPVHVGMMRYLLCLFRVVNVDVVSKSWHFRIDLLLSSMMHQMQNTRVQY
ncbi:uncharacterized protein LOC123401452 isoform X2 [Hordeum vulgare subsp. vulgare]|uniref:Predicted protein n=1 Tax=Hordeum vulgare subsp. vulgare TaxID=112509 RepID=F2EKD4_HORVV|nr:uncharacterized protein LOC123401452 isoform X2 [Hordeum vulgare subsp. vulgare]XP_044951208.1 uncharacterized protein LOC123401452 isoform X2 [Hordeum vulgare subsp. vulgare]BAK07806.1 predicted protein [Hordeum vulgare subsp. vulgare]